MDFARHKTCDGRLKAAGFQYLNLLLHVICYMLYDLEGWQSPVERAALEMR